MTPQDKRLARRIVVAGVAVFVVSVAPFIAYDAWGGGELDGRSIMIGAMIVAWFRAVSALGDAYLAGQP